MEQEDLMQKNIAHIINIASKYYNLPLSILSQSTIKASDAMSRAQTELRNYWKKNLEERIGKSSRKHQDRSKINIESANEFSGGKQRGNQVRINPTSRGQNQKFSGNPKGERSVGNRKLEEV
jgi:hypothetical protein